MTKKINGTIQKISHLHLFYSDRVLLEFETGSGGFFCILSKSRIDGLSVGDFFDLDIPDSVTVTQFSDLDFDPDRDSIPDDYPEESTEDPCDFDPLYVRGIDIIPFEDFFSDSEPPEDPSSSPSSLDNLFSHPDLPDDEDPIYGEILSVSICEDIVCVLLHTDTGDHPLVLSLDDYERCGITLPEIVPGRKIYYERPINFIDLI